MSADAQAPTPGSNPENLGPADSQASHTLDSGPSPLKHLPPRDFESEMAAATGKRGNKNKRRPKSPIETILGPLASLKLTVVLLLASMFLILAGTLAQVDQGLWKVLDEYFRSFGVMIPLDIFRTFLPFLENVDARIPFPGGALLGSLILVNLLAAHGLRFKIKARGLQIVHGLLWLLGGIAAICVAFLFPPITNKLASNLPILFGLGSLFFVPLMVGSWVLFGKRMGVVLIHASLILLLVGEGITAVKAVEMQMPIYEGQTTSWAHDVRESELAIMLPKDDGTEQVWAITQKALENAAEKQQTIRAQGMPFGVVVERWFNNATVMPTPPMMQMQTREWATDGLAKDGAYALIEREDASGASAQNDLNAAIVRLVDDNNQPLGQYLVSVLMQDKLQMVGGQSFLFLRQDVPVGEATYQISMRYKRHEMPYQVTLKDFSHDLYPGTNRPKNFSSDIVITDPSKEGTSAHHIKMNDPLRYEGETFFQASFLPNDIGTVLQVVQNPGWTVPYISCIVGGLGLLIHFVMTLVGFLRKESKLAAKAQRQTAAAPETTTQEGEAATQAPALLPTVAPLWRFGPAVLLPLVLAGWLGAAWMKSPDQDTFNGYNLPGMGQLVVLKGGRYLPLDSVARDTLLAINGKSVTAGPDDGLASHQSWPKPNKDKPAIAWLIDTWAAPEVAAHDKVVRIDNPGVKDLIGVFDRDRKQFSRVELSPHFDAIMDAVRQAQQKDKAKRSAFELAVLDLYSHLNEYTGVLQQSSMYFPPAAEAIANNPGVDDPHAVENGLWRPMGDVTTQTASDDLSKHYQQALLAYSKEDAAAFNESVNAMLLEQARLLPNLHKHVALEQSFDAHSPYQKTIVLYVIALLLVVASWCCIQKPAWHVGFKNAAFGVVVLAFVLQSIALLIRMHLSGRPPVTNLYSSAVFIGWAVVGICLPLERFARFGLSLLSGCCVGIATLLVAKGLEDGDTMQVLQAVLDTNFWLATHVLTITLGYAATFVAMIFGIVYILGGLFTPMMADKRDEKHIRGLVYGTTCFALLLSFVGTILGGIWADQSWGRFWGWDPKENGAMLIVLWTALVLHARWGGLVKGRGLAVLSVLGGGVTIWSWFGTNLLGTGLHSYGFMDGAFFWCRVGWVALIVVSAFASVPTRDWVSFQKTKSHATPIPPKNHGTT